MESAFKDLIFPMILVLGFLLMYLAPILVIMFSKKTTGKEKIAWILAVIFISWFAWIFYALLAPLTQKR
ncbi:hypothetical protein [Chryseobacterium sp. MFBS3-17]|uniref:hypothetical protein n=1 Tax=Chryseobacterium sp. MFBS3-17 TaxID=2886689 RepID=UPI001D0E7C55|nr:hypothetical protein [Chryseobacterium sp. MFBS3-17]MCC2590410.1 hypothetical protein [Chryseobacterium sp. MFBS3-17]